MAPYEVFYGKRYRSPLHWKKIGENDVLAQSLGLEMIAKMIKEMRLI